MSCSHSTYLFSANVKRVHALLIFANLSANGVKWVRIRKFNESEQVLKA